MELLGEIEITLGGEQIVLRPTFKGILQIEEKSEKKVGELYESFIQTRFGLKETTAVIYGGMYGANGNKPPKYSFDQIGELVLKEGLAGFYACGFFVASIYSGKSLAELKPKETDVVAVVEEKKS